MQFGPFELQACGENDYTMKSLGLLAFRPDLRERLIRQLAGDNAIADGEPSSILFFSRIGENFFREAIVREKYEEEAQLELRCNLALGLPSDFRWVRTKNGRLMQPAKWQLSHIRQMLLDNDGEGDQDFLELLKSIQNDLNTEPDVVLQWGGRMIMIEVKVLSGQGHQQLDRQRRLGEFLAAMTGLESADVFLLGPSGGKPPADPSCRFISWGQVSDWFADIPEIADYIRHSAFFYKGHWRTMISPVVSAPGPTAWNMMLCGPAVVPPLVQKPALATPAPAGAGHLEPAGGQDVLGPWALEHLGPDYFAKIIRGCRHHGIWPLQTIWTGRLGLPYGEKAKGRRVNPNWMVEDTSGRRRTRDGGFEQEDSYDASNVIAWSYEQVAETFGLKSD